MKTIHIVVSLFFLSSGVFAQWTPTGGPEGGWCNDMKKVGNTIWAAYPNGIYISTDEGNTWNKNSLFSNYTNRITSKGDSIVVVEYNNINIQSYTSFDGGITWNPPIVISSNVSYPPNMDLFTTDSSLIAFISDNGNYYISSDFGITWSIMPVPASQFNNLIANSGKFQVLYGADTNATFHLYYSANGGNYWIPFDTLYGSSAAFIIDSTFYISTLYYDTAYHSFLARTNDFGLSWDTLGLDGVPYGFSNLNMFNGKMYCTSSTMVFMSPDTGVTWQPSDLPHDLFWVWDGNFIKLSNAEWLSNQFNNGLFHYNDSTGIFYHSEAGINSNEIRFLSSNNGSLFASTENTVFISSNNGVTWNRAPSFVYGGVDLSFYGDTILGTAIRIDSSGNTSYGQNICYSFDNGLTWDTATLQNGYHLKGASSIVLLNGKIYVSNYNYVASSNDWGLNWDSVSTFIDTVPPFCGSFYNGSLVVHRGALYLSSTDGLVIQLDTISGTWKNKLCYSAPGVHYQKMYSLDDKLVITDSYYYYLSSDSGNTWSTPSLHGLPYYGSVLNTYSPQRIASLNGTWFGLCNGKIFYTFNFGETWHKLYDGNQFLARGGITFLNNNLFSGSYRDGVWSTLGGLNLVSGTAFDDINNNGLKNGGEPGLKNIAVHSSQPDYIFLTDSVGQYSIYTAGTGDTLEAITPTGYCTLNPTTYITSGPASNANLGIYFYPGVQDLAVDLTNINAFRSGFNTLLDVTVLNKGTITIPSQLTVTIDPLLSYISADIPPSLVSGNTLTWNLDTLTLLQAQQITLTVLTPAAAAIGTPISCMATVIPLVGDTVPANNTSTCSSSVVNSFDPNDKTFFYGNYFTPTQVQQGDEMVYTIRFQNLGNYTADNIFIKDTLDPNLEKTSFHVISSSHLVNWESKGLGSIEFSFENIHLPPASSDELGSHGYVKYGVLCDTSILTGSTIENTAYIYFDYNSPILTNTTYTIIDDPTGIDNPASGAFVISVFPNPANTILNVRIHSQINDFILNIYNAFGVLVHRKSYTGHHFMVDTQSLYNGIYTCRLVSSINGESHFFKFVVLK